MKMNQILSNLILCLPMTLSSLSEADELKVPPLNEDRKTVHFTIKVSKKDCQEILSKLPDATIQLDKAETVARLARYVKNSTNDLTKERHQQIAEEIYKSKVAPFIGRRVEKFNELMNEALTDDEVGAGFLAFRGLAKAMAATNHVSAITVEGRFEPDEEDAEREGKWSWSTFSGGVGSSHRTLSAAVDERMTISLEPYGITETFDFDLSCNGEVKLEKEYKHKYHLVEKPRGAQESKVRLLPEMNLSAKKSVTTGTCFKLIGDNYSSVNKKFFYDATMELSMSAGGD